MEKRLPRPVRNVMANWAASLASMLIALFLSPFIVHRLGSSAYGVWVLIISITGYLGLLDLGVRGAVTCYVARFHAQGKHDEAGRLASSALVFFTAVGTVAFAASVAGALLAPRWFHVPEHLSTTFQAVLILAGASLAITLVGNVYGAIVIARQRFDVANCIDITALTLKSGIILVALFDGKGLLSLAIIHVTFSAMTAFTYLWASRRIYPRLSVRYIRLDRPTAGLIFSFGGSLFLLNASTYLILYTDSVVIGAFMPVAMVTSFAIAGNLIASSRSLVSGISTTMSPLASSLDAEGDRRKITEIGLAGPRYATMLVVPIVITFALRGKTFIGLWMGAEYANVSSQVLQVLSLTLFFGAANQVATSTILGLNKHRTLVFVNITEGILNLALSIGLVRVLGVVGVAWGTTIPHLATSLIFWPLYARRTFGVTRSQYALSTWGRPAAAAIPFAVLTVLIDRTWQAPGMGLFFLQVLLSFPALFLGFWHACLSSAERRGILSRIFSPPVKMGEVA